MSHNVIDHGADNSGVISSYSAIKAAIAAAEAAGGGEIFFPAGVYSIGKHDQYSGVFINNNKPLYFRGEGMGVSTIKVMTADYTGKGAFYMLRVKSDRIKFSDLTFDGNRDCIITNDEQTHLMQVELCKNITIENCEFVNGRRDGIKILGLDGYSFIEDLTINQCHFSNCGRSGITAQHSFRFARFTNNYFIGINDQAIDWEPTSVQAPSKVIMTGNIINGSGQGQIAVTLSGVSGLDRASSLVFSNNIIFNGTVFSTDTRNLIFQGNNISAPAGYVPATFSRGHENLIIDGNVISTANQSGVSLFAANGRFPNKITISNNNITTHKHNAISMESVQNACVSNNTLTDGYNTGLTGVFMRSTSLGIPIRDITVNGNIISGFGIGVGCYTTQDDGYDISITNNIMVHRGVGNKVGCAFQSSGGKLPRRVLLANNSYGAGISTPVVGGNIIVP